MTSDAETQDTAWERQVRHGASLVLASGLSGVAAWWGLQRALAGVDPESPPPWAELLHGSGDPMTSPIGGLTALGVGVGLYLLTSRRAGETELAHAWGAWVLRLVGLTAVGASLARLGAFHTGSPWLRSFATSLWTPTAMLALFMGFALVGRLLRHAGDRRVATLADTVALAAPFLLVASSLSPVGPPAGLVAASGLAALCAAAVLARLAWSGRAGPAT